MILRLKKIVIFQHTIHKSQNNKIWRQCDFKTRLIGMMSKLIGLFVVLKSLSTTHQHPPPPPSPPATNFFEASRLSRRQRFDMYDSLMLGNLTLYQLNRV